MLCPDCKIQGIIEPNEQICPRCGLVINDVIFDTKTLEKDVKIQSEQLSTVVMQNKVNKDGSGKLLSFTQRNIAKRLKNWQKRMRLITSTQRNNFNVTLHIDKFSNSLSLAPSIKNEIKDLYIQLKNKGLTRRKVYICNNLCNNIHYLYKT